MNGESTARVTGLDDVAAAALGVFFIRLDLGLDDFLTDDGLDFDLLTGLLAADFAAGALLLAGALVLALLTARDLAAADLLAAADFAGAVFFAGVTFFAGALDWVFAFFGAAFFTGLLALAAACLRALLGVFFDAAMSGPCFLARERNV